MVAADSEGRLSTSTDRFRFGEVEELDCRIAEPLQEVGRTDDLTGEQLAGLGERVLPRDGIRLQPRDDGRELVRELPEHPRHLIRHFWPFIENICILFFEHLIPSELIHPNAHTDTLGHRVVTHREPLASIATCDIHHYGCCTAHFTPLRRTPRARQTTRDPIAEERLIRTLRTRQHPKRAQRQSRATPSHNQAHIHLRQRLDSQDRQRNAIFNRMVDKPNH